MFKIVSNPRAWWPVTWRGVTEDGKVRENRIEMRFVLHSEDAWATLLAEAAKLPQRAEELAGDDADAEDRERALSSLYAEFVERLAVDWREVGAENGDPLKFEGANMKLLMNVPGVFAATVEAYGRCRRGEKKLREGN